MNPTLISKLKHLRLSGCVFRTIVITDSGRT